MVGSHDTVWDKRWHKIRFRLIIVTNVSHQYSTFNECIVAVLNEIEIRERLRDKFSNLLSFLMNEVNALNYNVY